MAGRGGFRPGAGRPKVGQQVRALIESQVPESISPIRKAELKLMAALPDLVDRVLAMALAGDRAMLVYSIDRVLGRTIQPIAIETQIEELAADFGVEPERVISIIERLKAKRAG